MFDETRWSTGAERPKHLSPMFCAVHLVEEVPEGD